MTTSDQSSASPGRPEVRPPLTRDTILTAARDLVSREGFDALTMRRVASELGKGAMTLYTYFRGRDELVAALLDELFGTIAVTPNDAEDWQHQLRRLARAHREMLHRFPSAIPYFLATLRSGPHAARFGESMLSVLRRAELSDEAAVGSFFTVLALNYGFAGFEAVRRRPGTPGEQWEEGVRRTQMSLALLPEQEFPLTVAMARPLARFATTDEQYEFALDVVVAGIAHQH